MGRNLKITLTLLNSAASYNTSKVKPFVQTAKGAYNVFFLKLIPVLQCSTVFYHNIVIRQYEAPKAGLPIFVSVFSAPPCHSANCGNLVGWEELPYVLLSTFSYSHTVWCNKWQSVASLARNHLVNQAAACWSPGPTLPISPLKLSGPFINLGTNQKYAKAHHSLNSHISSSCIPPKLAAKKS